MAVFAPPAGTLFEEHCERALAFIEQLHQTRVWAVAEVVACLHLLGPAFELAQIDLELLQLPEREVAVFGLAGHVLEQLHGLAGDVGVFLGPRRARLIDHFLCAGLRCARAASSTAFIVEITASTGARQPVNPFSSRPVRSSALTLGWILYDRP